ncbi:hypothetical protein F-LCD7_0162 [Faustovirus]|nr:hypothetical protein F-LCD7_0162 [Faustovirus]
MYFNINLTTTMLQCVSCKTPFTHTTNTHCATCLGLIRAFWAPGVAGVNNEFADQPAALVGDGWLNIKGANDQTVFQIYLRVLEIVGLANIPNTWEIIHLGYRYVLKLDPVNINKPQDHIVKRGVLDNDNKVLTQMLFIRRTHAVEAVNADCTAESAVSKNNHIE